MNKQAEYKIGFSHLGGIYIGKGVPIQAHKHIAITLVIPMEGDFAILSSSGDLLCGGVMIQPNTDRRFYPLTNSLVAFVHIDPYSEIGLALLREANAIFTLGGKLTRCIRDILYHWFYLNENSEAATKDVIHEIYKQLGITQKQVTFDRRIFESLELIQHGGVKSLQVISDRYQLSTFRFSHLFKE